MSEWNAYIVPADATYRPTKEQIDGLIAQLRSKGIIGDQTDLGVDGWAFSMGEKGSSAMDEPDWEDATFEALVIRDTSFVRLIPEEFLDGYEPKCPDCKTDLDQLFDDEYATKVIDEGRQVGDVTVTCHACNKATPICDLSFGIETSRVYFSLEFVSFPARGVSITLLMLVQGVLGLPLQVLWGQG